MLNRKILMAGLFVAPLFIAGAAGAQTSGKMPAPEDSATGNATQNAAAGLDIYVEVDDDNATVPRLNVRVGELEDMKIYGADGNVIGEIDDALGTPDGAVKAVSVEVGGFLGIGDKEAIVPLDELQLDGLRLTLPLSKNQIEDLPEWNEG
ncbi:PRC-barrel domain-containing protein [Afifella aestuarii]|uniref:PRC-barrel domain-containing protein n=1 Tax=Afifella aestuarii TaxID=1909496 RepID=UPI000FE2AB24|nr:PRC-barrel domain-containing protein [Afifella aestuarii]